MSTWAVVALAVGFVCAVAIQVWIIRFAVELALNEHVDRLVRALDNAANRVVKAVRERETPPSRS